MITRLTLRNFKSVESKVYDFSNFDLLVGRNNSGKSTVLQSLAIWQFCVDEFHRTKRSGTTGIQVILPNFTALPLPEFNLLWKDRTDRVWPTNADGVRKQQYILIQIIVDWTAPDGSENSFGVDLRYSSPQTIYAIPAGGWNAFKSIDEAKLFPRIAYVPPFSGLEPLEEWRDDGPIRKQVGKAQPGSVLRNLLFRVLRENRKAEWNEVVDVVKRWFSVQLLEPKYLSGQDTQITVEFRQGERNYDIIAGGSGFHQTLTLLAFLYGLEPTTILLDEPDAHLHVNLQREILDYFREKSLERGTQFLIATHAEEFARGVDPSQILSLLSGKPKRIESTPEVLGAMADVTNDEIARVTVSPFILYVEGETDERILRAWANECGAQSSLDRMCFKRMDGGGKKDAKERADKHFDSLKHIVPDVRRLMLQDLDGPDAWHPEPSNPTMCEWKRKNIENYLLVPPAWHRVALKKIGLASDDLFAQSVLKVISDFFAGENLTLPPKQNWRDLHASIFSIVDGKNLLYAAANSLFQQLRSFDPPVQILREEVALTMTADEIHSDVHEFFAKVNQLTAVS